MFDAKLPGKQPYEGKPISFKSEISKVTTMADNGIRLQLELAEDEVVNAMSLMYLKQQKVIVEVQVKPYKPEQG